MNLKIFLVIIILISVQLSLAFNTNRDENGKICEHFKKIKCFSDENAITVNFDGSYIELNIKLSESSIELKCHQRRELRNYLLENIPQINLTKIEKMKITRCVLGENSFMKNFLDRLSLKNLKKIDFDLKLKKDKEITSDIFDGLRNVQEMKLNTEKSHNFQTDSFGKLESLTVLSLHVYDVMDPQIPSHLFTAMRKLEILSIVSSAAFRENKNSQVKNFTLMMDDFMNLKEFSLEGVRWHFQLQLKLPKMVNEVKITKNLNLTKFGEEEFKRNDQIENLDLSRNSLKEIHPRAFWRQRNLLKINLSFNKLSTINEKLFAENTELEILDLSNNNLETLGFKIFASLSSLKSLKLDDNNLKEILLTNSFDGITNLEILSLNHNQISKFQQEMPACVVKRLDLRNNNLSKFFLHNFLKNSQSSHLEIQLENNPLESIDFSKVEEKLNSSDFKLIVDVGSSPIKCNCHTLSFNEFLNQKSFEDKINYDKVEIRPDDVRCHADEPDGALILVKEIDTSRMICSLDNDHQNLCPSSCTCKNWAFKKLEITCRKIYEVPVLPPYKFISKSVTSIILNVKGNSIAKLPNKSRETYNHVIEINAAFNNIQELHEYNLPDALESIDLTHNLLKTISPEVLIRFEYLELVHLSDNLWNCTASKELIIFVKNHRDIVKDFNHIKCGGKFFLEFDFDSNCGPLIFILLPIILLTFGFGTAIFFYSKYHPNLSEWIFVHDKYHVVEKVKDTIMMKKFDICFVMSSYDVIMVKYIADRLKSKPNEFKCAFVTKNWAPNEIIPSNVISTLKKSRRVAIILSEYFEEDNWNQWSYSNIHARLIIIEKNSMSSSGINLVNKMAVKFSDPWFWDKLKFIITHRREMEVENDESANIVEMQPLNVK